MATTSDAPADTTMMRIVHDALRRDLARAGAALADQGVAGAQRRVLADHVAWMVRFLHAHHASEDAGLYPLARERAGDDVAALDVLDRMAAAHEAVAGAIADVEAAVAALQQQPTDETARATAAALHALEAVLLPHLREEEDEAMPIVSQLITHAEWLAAEKTHNLDTKSMSELAYEGHWLIDGASAADRATVVGLVPPIQRFFLVHALGRPYRRRARRCWRTGRGGGRRVQLENQVRVTVPAGIDEVWDVVRDVTRVGEWSHECVAAEWLDGARGAVPGARFRGRNRNGAFRWGRICEIVSAEPYELVWVTVSTPLFPDSSEWRIWLQPVEGGTQVSQAFRVVRAPKMLAVLFGVLLPAHRDRTAALLDDLRRLGTVASASAVAAAG